MTSCPISAEALQIGHTGDLFVNTALSKRSSGSVLKPFIYLEQINQGMLTAVSEVDDKRLKFDDYNVRNFTGDFKGDIYAQRALTSSLNAPAVKLLYEIGVDDFLSSLKKLKFSTLDRSADDYGLSLALGGAEISLIELVNAYSCLANNGNIRPWQLINRGSKSERLYDAGAVTVLNKMLRSESLGPGAEDRVCWKTGTSNDFRDAWCVGYNHEYTIGVWLGNHGGEASRSLIGSESAAPLVLKAFKQIYPSGLPIYFDREVLAEVEVCSKSGLHPSPFCQKKILAEVSQNIPLALCREHAQYRDEKADAQLLILSPEPGNYSCVDEVRLELKSNESASWFINGKYQGKGKRWLDFGKGRYEIRCVSQTSSDSIEISVR